MATTAAMPVIEAHLLSPVSCLLSPASCLLTPDSCLLSPLPYSNTKLTG